MSKGEVKFLEKIINNIQVFGLENAVRVSKYPMSIDTANLNNNITSTVNNLAKTPIGTGHDNFLLGIIVQFDLTFTIKAWIEMERYHFFDIISSQSTMHRITKFNIDTAYIEYVDKRTIDVIKDLIEEYNNTDDVDKKNKLYLKILYSNPCGMKLTAGVTTNYRQLKTIYKQRKNHRLPEWQNFCKEIEKLPFSEWITQN